MKTAHGKPLSWQLAAHTWLHTHTHTHTRGTSLELRHGKDQKLPPLQRSLFVVCLFSKRDLVGLLLLGLLVLAVKPESDSHGEN